VAGHIDIMRFYGPDETTEMGFKLQRSCNYFALIAQFRFERAISIVDDGSIATREESDLGCLQIYQIEDNFPLFPAVVEYTNQFNIDQMEKSEDPYNLKHKMSKGSII
jgi:hypothetical protein